VSNIESRIDAHLRKRAEIIRQSSAGEITAEKAHAELRKLLSDDLSAADRALELADKALEGLIPTHRSRVCWCPTGHIDTQHSSRCEDARAALRAIREVKGG